MTPVNLPYLWLPVFRGRQYAYYRRAGQRVRITTGDGKPLAPSDAGFVAAYQRIHATFERPGVEKPSVCNLEDAASHVYFVKSADCVKIGYTSDIWSRMAQLRCETPLGLELIVAVVGNRLLERHMHDVFKNYWSSREWFRIDGILDRFLSNFIPGTFISKDRALSIIKELS